MHHPASGLNETAGRPPIFQTHPGEEPSATRSRGTVHGGKNLPKLFMATYVPRFTSAYLRNSYGKVGWIPESGKLDPGIAGSGGISGSEDLAGAEDFTGAVENRSGLL